MSVEAPTRGHMGEIIFEPTKVFDRSVEAVTLAPSGLYVYSSSGQYGELRAWIKVKGEPAQVVWCTPDEFQQVWRKYAELDDPKAVIAACNFAHGLPNYYFHHIIDELVYIGVTHKSNEEAKPAPGSIWMPDWKGPKSGVWIER